MHSIFVKILVTGGIGYIGITVAELLVNTGHQAVSFDNFESRKTRSFTGGVEFVEGELAHRADLENLFISTKAIG